MSENFEKRMQLVENALNKSKIPYQKPEKTTGLWLLSLKTSQTGPILNIKIQMVDKEGYFTEVSADMGEVPPNPKEQWAMFLRLLQLNYYETNHGRFAIDERRNEIIYIIFKETDIMASQFNSIIDIVAFIFNDIRPRALGFIN